MQRYLPLDGVSSSFKVVSFHSCYSVFSLVSWFSFLTSCVHLISLPTHSRWLRCCFVIPKSLSVFHGSRAMEKRIDELEGRLAAIDDELSGVVNQFNDDTQKFKDEMEFHFAQHKLVLREVVEGARKEFEGLRQAIHGLHVETANTVTNLQQRVVHLESNLSGAYTNKGYLPQKSMIPKNFTDKADAWRSWQLRGHNDPGNEEGTCRDRPRD